MQAKPILIFRPHFEADFKTVDETIEMLSENLPDYHVLAVQFEDQEIASFEVLNPRDADDVQIEEIKKMVGIRTKT